MERYKIYYGFYGAMNPYFCEYVYANEDTIETIAKAIVMSRLRTLDNTYCNYRNSYGHEESIWSNKQS